MRCTVALAGVVVVATVLCGGLVGCASDAPKEPVAITVGPIAAGEAPLRVELIAAAIDAVEASLGAPQRFFEINATPTIVNLFVAADDGTQAVAYVYAAGELGQPAAPLAASGPTFASTEVDFDASLVLAEARAQLPTSDFRLFSITGLDNGGVNYQAVITSTQGTEFVVYVSSNGDILGTDQTLGVES